MDPILNEINRKYVRINQYEKTYNSQVVHALLEKILKIMRDKNHLFKIMNPKIAYLGSYYDGLRVGHATEFDINIVLKLPINYKNIVLDASNKEAYTVVKMPSEFRRLCKIPITATNGFTETEFWCDKLHRLSVKKFRSWMQSVLDSALSTLPKTNDKYSIKVNDKIFPITAKLSGPANTISIYDNNSIIDVDLVPTFEFNLEQNKPRNCAVDFSMEIFKFKKQYFIVPKPTDDEYIWRLAFPYQEKAIMNNKNNFKSAVKLIKLLRDTQEFNKLASYYIKTLFIWEVTRKPSKFWRKSLSFLVLYMMEILRDQLRKKEIQNYWSPRHNLLNTVKEETLENWCNRLTYIINDIKKNKEKNPSIIRQYFEKQTFKQERFHFESSPKTVSLPYRYI